MDEADTATHLTRDLENEYCPPLDPALFAAIVSDYDLSDETSIQQLRDTLDALKLSAVEQEDVLFDPSGTSGYGVIDEIEGVTSEQSISQRTLQSLDTNITSLGSNLSSLDIDQDGYSDEEQDGLSRTLSHSAENSDAPSNLMDLSFDGRKAYLNEMFPSIDQFTVAHTLKKCDGDIDQSMDILLNLAFFEQGQVSDRDEFPISIPKGIDGFQGALNRRNNRKKGKGKAGKAKKLVEHSAPSSPVTCGPTRSNSENRWDHGKKDVDFICSRTTLSAKTVNSIYHRHGASLPATIHSVVDEELRKHSNEDLMENPVTCSQVVELQEEFPTVTPNKLAGLLQLTRNSISAANELATVMITEPPPTLLPNIGRINLPANSNDSNNTRKIAKSVPASPTPWNRPDHNTSRALADRHMVAGQVAFEKASAAYRRGKSDRLMGGAAGYYAIIGRDHVDRAKRETAAAAEALVDSQSTKTVLDLHGVSVQHAVRIATSRVENWWESLGDSKYRTGGGGPAREGYRIITGLGRHSKNGMARLGPAVARTLAKEGWRVEVGEGVLVVTGMVRHR